jgi:putative endonuclease
MIVTPSPFEEGLGVRSNKGTYFFWNDSHQPLPLRSTSRSRAAVARRAHNPKVGSSILPFATKEGPPTGGLLIMFTVYVLYSELFDKIYIGYTSNLDERLKAHNELATKGWTIKFRPWKLVHTEFFESKTDAMLREKQLKSAAGRLWVWKLIRGS